MAIKQNKAEIMAVYTIAAVAGLLVAVFNAPTNAQAPPVSVVIQSDKDSVKPGDVVTYKIIVQSDSGGSMRDVSVVSRVPDFLIPIATAPEASLDSQERTVTWYGMDLAAGSSVELGLRAQVQFTASEGHNLSHDVSVLSDAGQADFSHSMAVAGGGQAQVAGVPSPVSAKTGSGITIPLLLVTALLPPAGLVATCYYLKK